jgi:hypothetical protein
VGTLSSNLILEMGKNAIHQVSPEPLVKWQSQFLFQNFIKRFHVVIKRERDFADQI